MVVAATPPKPKPPDTPAKESAPPHFAAAVLSSSEIKGKRGREPSNNTHSATMKRNRSVTAMAKIISTHNLKEERMALASQR